MGLGRIVKFGLLCLVVGLVLTTLGMGVEDFWKWVAENATDIGDWVYDHGRWAITYIVVGAGVLVPIYLVRFLVGQARGRRK